jgi:hypothetical protein
MRCSYDPTCLYVSQGTALSAFGCGERHPLPVVLAPCSADSSCNLCDELADAFPDDSNAGCKVTHSSLVFSNRHTLHLLLTYLQSMPLLPVSTWGAKLWVEIDGRAQDKVKRYAVAAAAAAAAILTLTAGALGNHSLLSCATAQPTYVGLLTRATHVPASACTLPSAVTPWKFASTCPGRRRVTLERTHAIVISQEMSVHWF